jgi:putative pyruvate formate lyase activating enzyme
MRFLARQLSRDTYVNIMDQYRPAWRAVADPRYSPISRPVTGAEVRRAYEHACEAGLWRFDSRWRPIVRLLPLGW